VWPDPCSLSWIVVAIARYLRRSFATGKHMQDATTTRARRRTATTIRVLCVSALLIVGCSSASTSGPTADSTWHGAAVEGTRLEEGIQVLDAAWPRVSRRFPGRDLAGWRIVWGDTSIDLTAYPTALCGAAPCAPGSEAVGLTLRQSRVIQLSWAMPPSRLVAVAAWELCNALSDSGDRGCS
jgi:hypothetical protein